MTESPLQAQMRAARELQREINKARKPWLDLVREVWKNKRDRGEL